MRVLDYLWLGMGQIQAEVDSAAQTIDKVSSSLTTTAPQEMAEPGVLHFIAQSDWVGQSLFIILLIMSVVTWYLVFFKGYGQWQRKKRARRFVQAFWSARSLDEVAAELKKTKADDSFSLLTKQALEARGHQSQQGAERLGEQGGMEGFLMRMMRKTIAEETAKLENGLTVLASIASTAPFVGLFGTVWGVYHALVNIGLGGEVALSNIAGPVGEALIMTGLGLAVAIPAVIAYNAFIRSNRVYLAGLDAFAHDLFTFLTVGQTPANAGQSKTHTQQPTSAQLRSA